MTNSTRLASLALVLTLLCGVKTTAQTNALTTTFFGNNNQAGVMFDMESLGGPSFAPST